jgi:hypothetical protein
VVSKATRGVYPPVDHAAKLELGSGGRWS